MERLRSGSGASGLDDARTAGRDAAAAALERLGGAEPVLVLVYASVRYDLEQLLAGIREVTGEAPLAGATSSGHFDGDTVVQPGQGVAVLVLAGGPYRFGVASGTGIGARPEALGADLARAAKAAAQGPSPEGAGGPHTAFILLTGSLGGDQQAVLTGVHRVCGAAVPVIGGAAGDDQRMERTSVFHDGAVLDDAAVGIWVSSPRPLSVGTAHGWKPQGVPQFITRAEGTRIQEIGGRPAGEVFSELTTGVAGPQQTLAETARQQVAFALGLLEPDGSHLVRDVYPAPEGMLNSYLPLAPHSAVQVMKADPQTLLSVIDDVVEGTMTHGDESVLLAFDCVTRMSILGPDHHEEVVRIAKAAGSAHVFGTYTYGEFARAQGVGGVHNATLTALAL